MECGYSHVATTPFIRSQGKRKLVDNKGNKHRTSSRVPVNGLVEQSIAVRKHRVLGALGENDTKITKFRIAPVGAALRPDYAF